jgi:hypothetical protein
MTKGGVVIRHHECAIAVQHRVIVNFDNDLRLLTRTWMLLVSNTNLAEK